MFVVLAYHDQHKGVNIRVLAVFVEEAAAVAYAGKLCEGDDYADGAADAIFKSLTDASPCKRHLIPSRRRHAPTGHSRRDVGESRAVARETRVG
jgi:hypothetical protein